MENFIKSTEYDYNLTNKTIKLICQNFPDAQCFSIGKSCAGRELMAIKIGKGESYSLFAAAFHGSEHITTNLSLYFANELCSALQNNRSLAGINARKALCGRGVIIIPRVNPDGCEISIHGAAACGALAGKIGRLCRNNFSKWNANLRGVDINHNFNADWQKLHRLERQSGIFGPAPTRFGGFSPESEPETMALCQLCNTYNIHHVAALHSQGEVIYWGYNDICYSRSKQMAQIMSTASGYALDVPCGLAQGGGFKDWFVLNFSRPGFTIEVGKGENPLDITSDRKIYMQIREMLMLCAIM